MKKIKPIIKEDIDLIIKVAEEGIDTIHTCDREETRVCAEETLIEIIDITKHLMEEMGIKNVKDDRKNKWTQQ